VRTARISVKKKTLGTRQGQVKCLDRGKKVVRRPPAGLSKPLRVFAKSGDSGRMAGGRADGGGLLREDESKAKETANTRTHLLYARA
jgi:hypothetical protein